MEHWHQTPSLTCPLQQDAMTSILHYVITSRSRSAFLLRPKNKKITVMSNVATAALL